MINSKILLIIFFLFTALLFESCKDNSTNLPPSSSHINLIGQRDTPGNSEGIYVYAVNNLNYAFVADGSSGLQVISVFVPSSPVISGGYNTVGEANDVF